MQILFLVKLITALKILYGGSYMSKKKNSPSSEVDQKKLVDDKAKAARENNFEDQHIRRVTPNGADGQ